MLVFFGSVSLAHHAFGLRNTVNIFEKNDLLLFRDSVQASLEGASTNQYDSAFFRFIAREGYPEPEDENQKPWAFFPLYPSKIQFVLNATDWIFENRHIPVNETPNETLKAQADHENRILYAMTLLTFMVLILVLVMWYRVHGFGVISTLLSTISVIFFPTALYFQMLYTEALFVILYLFLVLIVFRLPQKYLTSAVVPVILLSLLRPQGIVVVGITLLFGLVHSYAQQKNEFSNWIIALKKNWLNFVQYILLGGIAIACVGGFLLYGKTNTGNMWISRDAQSLFGRSDQSTIRVDQTVVSFFENQDEKKQNCRSNFCLFEIQLRAFTVIFWLVSLTIAIIVLPKSIENWSYNVTSLALLTLPLTSSSLGSLHRYIIMSPIVLILIPSLWSQVISISKHRYLQFAIYSVWIVTILVSLYYFIQASVLIFQGVYF